MKHKLHVSLFFDIIISVFIAINLSTQVATAITPLLTIPLFQMGMVIYKQFLCLEITKVFYAPKTRTKKQDIFNVFVPIFIYQYLMGLFAFTTMKKALDGELYHIGIVWITIGLLSIAATLTLRFVVLAKLKRIVMRRQRDRTFCDCGKEHP